jgi:hypothetical protein
MSGWGWVALGYGSFYIAIGVYIMSLVGRTRRAQARLAGRR